MADEMNAPQSENAAQKAEAGAPATPAPASVMPTAMRQPAPAKTTNYIALFAGVFIIVLALALGGLYLWGAMLVNDETMLPEASVEETQLTETENAQTVPASADSIGSIEAELADDDIESIDAELNAIDAEIESGTSAQ